MDIDPTRSGPTPSTPQFVESRRLMGLIQLVSSRPAPRASGLLLVTQEHAMT